MTGKNLENLPPFTRILVEREMVAYQDNNETETQ